MPGIFVAYDDHCGVCLRFKRAIGFLDTRRSISYLSIEDAERRGLLDRVPPGLRRRSFHLVLPDGHTLSGAKAIPDLLALLPLRLPVSKILAATPFGLESLKFTYETLSRLHEKGSCRAATSRLAGELATGTNSSNSLAASSSVQETRRGR